MNEDARILKLPVLLVSMAFLLSAIGAFAFMDIGSELGPSSPEEVFEEGTSDEVPIAHGTRSPAMTTRSVLVELFTGTWCMFCPGAEGALDRLANEYPQTQLSILEYHVGPSIGYIDPFEVPGNYDRALYYSVSGYPTAVFDGIDVKSGGSTNPDDPTVYNDYKMRIDNRLPVPSPVTITLTGSLGPITGSFTANITAIDPIPPGLSNLKARFVVYEDHNYTYYQGPYEFRLRYTVVENLPEEPITINIGQTLEFTKTFNLDPSWDLNQLGACVFIQADSTQEILQTTSLNLSALSSKVDLALSPIDISFSDPTPYETQTITIYATVHNVGTLTTPSNVYVRFYNGDPDMGGSQIGAEQDAGIIAAGGSAMVQVDWDTTGFPWDNEIVVVVDPLDNIREPENENNNKAPKLIFVDPNPPQVDYIIIKDAPGDPGSWVEDSMYRLGDTDTFYAAGYNNSLGWIKDVDASWSSDYPSIGDVDPGPATSTTFSTLNPGTCNITADYSGLSNTTGVLTVSSFAILKQGWNLISLPLIQGDPSLTKVLESIDGNYDALQRYDITDSNDPWKHYKLGKPFGNDLSSIDETMGFWVYITQPGDTVFFHNGAPATVNQTIDLYPGWNLVGYPSLTSYDRTQGLNKLTFGTEVNSICSYDATTQNWKKLGSTDNFESGMGYWVHATTTCVWEVPV